MRTICTVVLTVFENILVVHSYVQIPQRWSASFKHRDHCNIHTAGMRRQKYDMRISEQSGWNAVRCMLAYISSVRWGQRSNLLQSKDCIVPNLNVRRSANHNIPDVGLEVKRRLNQSHTLIIQLWKTHLEFVGRRPFNMEFGTLWCSDYKSKKNVNYAEHIMKDLPYELGKEIFRLASGRNKDILRFLHVCKNVHGWWVVRHHR